MSGRGAGGAGAAAGDSGGEECGDADGVQYAVKKLFAGGLIGFDAALGDAVPVEASFDEAAAGLAHFAGEVGVGSNFEDGVGELGSVEGEDEAGIFLGDFEEMTIF